MPRKPPEPIEETPEQVPESKRAMIALVPDEVFAAFALYCIRGRIRSKQLEAGRVIEEFLKANGKL